MHEPPGAAPRAATTAEGAVRRLAESFRSAGIDTPELDARILVADALGMSRAASDREPGAHVVAGGSGNDRRL